MVRNVKHKDLRQIFSAKVEKMQKTNAKANKNSSVMVIDEKASSSTDVSLITAPGHDLGL